MPLINHPGQEAPWGPNTARDPVQALSRYDSTWSELPFPPEGLKITKPDTQRGSKTLKRTHTESRALPEPRYLALKSPGGWGGMAPPFQVGIETWFRVFRSVPTPALPGANSHWISGESRGGERTHTLTQRERETAPFWKNATQSRVTTFPIRKKKKMHVTEQKKIFYRDAKWSALKTGTPIAVEMLETWSCYNNNPRCLSFRGVNKTSGSKNTTKFRIKKADFYDI